MRQLSVGAAIGDTSVAGHWRLYARRAGVAPIEVTYFRGVQTGYGTAVREDPFGPKSFALTFPGITMWEAKGVGDLDWLGYGTDFDLIWDGALPAGYPGGGYSWEGYATSFDYTTDGGLNVTLVGALYQLDNYLAKPEYLQQPLPYEWAIAEQWRDRPDLHLKKLKVQFPTWWTTTYTPPPRNTRSYLIPLHVAKGDKWTGLTTRNTGSFDPALTSYIQTLLASMYTERGRFTLTLDPHRTPVLRHVDYKHAADATTLVLDPAQPGVQCTLNEDYSQSLNVAYGQGSSLTGEGYSGQVVTHDGTRTSYQPLAALRSVDPINDDNGWLDLSVMRKEVMLSMQQGLLLEDARKVGVDHLRRFTDPGITGTITVTSDPQMNGVSFPHALIKEGMTVQLPHVFGRAEGILVHVVSAAADLGGGSTTLTVDSKYRDALTVNEVKLRGRDALAVTRQLIGGQYLPAIPDSLLPWNYAEGSGYIPSGPDFSSQPLFDGMPDDIQFPWTEWTTSHPPSHPSWRKCYMKIAKKSANADLNWSYIGRREGGSYGRYGFPIKLAQAGTIRMVQLAAFDSSGNLLPLKFHFSIYNNRGVNVQSMPRITTADLGTSDGHAANQHYAFFDGAWESYKIDGSKYENDNNIAVQSVGLQRGWGTRQVPAGYWPGALSAGDAPTGLLQDETSWEFDTTNNVGLAWNPYTPQQNDRNAGYWYGMIYCESPVQDVFFLGRMFRAEPGATA